MKWKFNCNSVIIWQGPRIHILASLEEIVIIRHSQKPPLNNYADVSSGARSLSYALNLHLYPYFMYVSSEGSGESAHLHRLA